MPTLLDLCGIDFLPPGVEGRSLAPCLLRGEPPKKDEGYYINPQVNARGVMNHEHYYVLVRDWRDRETEILYDLREDPYQMRNIAAERPDLTRALRARLWAWLFHTKDPWTKYEEEAGHEGAI